MKSRAEAHSSGAKCNSSGSNCNFIFEGHRGSVLRAVTYGDFLISGGYDQIIRVWRVTSSFPRAAAVERTPSMNNGKLVTKPIFSIKAHDHMISALIVYINPRLNLDCIISASWDKLVKVWNLTTGGAIFSLEGHRNRVKSLAVVRKVDDETHGSSPDLNVQNASSGLHFDILFSGDDDGIIFGWNLNDGSKIMSFQGHDNFVVYLSSLQNLAMSNEISKLNEEYMLFSCGCDQTLRWWKKLRYNDSPAMVAQFHTEKGISAVDVFQFKQKYLYQLCNSTINGHDEASSLLQYGNSDQILMIIILATNDGNLHFLEANSGSVLCKFCISSPQGGADDHDIDKVAAVFVLENVDLSGLLSKSSKNSTLPLISRSHITLPEGASNSYSSQNQYHKCCVLYITERGELGCLGLNSIVEKTSLFQHMALLIPDDTKKSKVPRTTICGASIKECTISHIYRLVIFGSEGYLQCIVIPKLKQRSEYTVSTALNKADTFNTTPLLNDTGKNLSNTVDIAPSNSKNRQKKCVTFPRVQYKETPTEINHVGAGSFWANIDSSQYSFTRLKLYSRSSELIPIAKDLDSSHEKSKRNHSLVPTSPGIVQKDTQSQHMRHQPLRPLLL